LIPSGGGFFALDGAYSIDDARFLVRSCQTTNFRSAVECGQGTFQLPAQSDLTAGMGWCGGDKAMLQKNPDEPLSVPPN
jgi:hypothetical protein